MITKTILRAFDAKVYDLIQPYAITRDQDMPWAYQRANPKGRPLSNDWGFLWAPSFVQPWQSVPRMLRSYKIPQPFKCTAGKFVVKPMLWDPTYPLSPGTKTEILPYTTVNGTFQLLHAYVDVAIDDGAATFAAWLDNRWIDVFWQYHKPIPSWVPGVGGKVLKYYRGVRPDLTVSPPLAIGGSITSDMEALFPEMGCTLVTPEAA